ncbi:MAG: 16S rRNA (guanine(966)-N(2))-methyltransferase RsmD, partial [Burkholderiaceae bacterium]|nr:16S rRNA (guanine(966)-N(2))-methyltransferase RsmD [Burkholderiaceae bacterium]
MALSHRIRIIGGVWRSRQIQVLDQQDLRPSSDRV